MDSIWTGARRARANHRKMLVKDETLGSPSDELIAISANRVALLKRSRCELDLTEYSTDDSCIGYNVSRLRYFSSVGNF